MKTKTLTLKSLTIAFCLVLGFALIATASHADAATNLSKAKKKYKIAKDNVIKVEKLTKNKLNKAIDEASEKATAKAPCAVYVASGTINNGSFIVPKNVVLISEKKVTYNKSFFSVNGVVYGGKFDGKKRTNKILEISTSKYGKLNGVVEYTTVKNAIEVGITCFGSKATSMNNNTVTNCVKAGVGSYNGANVKNIKNNVIKKIGKGKTGSGINIVGAKAGNIVGNKVTYCKGHGLSTNYYVYKKGCSIKVVDKNTISHNGVHGVYLNKSKITKSMKKNKIMYNKKCGFRIDGKSSVRGYRGNKYKGNKSSDLSNAGKIKK